MLQLVVFYILNDLKCYRSAFSSSTNHLWMQSQRTSQEKFVKKIRFYKLQNVLFFILTPHTFKPRNFLISYWFWTILNAIGTPPKVLQIIFEMQCQGTSQKKAIKRIRFLKLQNVFFFIFFHFDPSYFQTS
jgi:hypothetical protein